MTYTVASHQVAIETLWLHFWGAVTSSIFIHSLLLELSITFNNLKTFKQEKEFEKPLCRL